MSLPYVHPAVGFYVYDFTRYTRVVRARASPSEPNAGDEDESGDQQERQEVEHHQEPQEQKIRLDTATKVPCQGENGRGVNKPSIGVF